MHDAILAAAALAEVDEVYRVGGAQAIAAMAYGTETIAPVDVIVGPGNAYVVGGEAPGRRRRSASTASRARPRSRSSPTTPSTPAWVAVDLLAQAEHGPGGAVALITWDEAVGRRGRARARRRCSPRRRRRDDAEATLRRRWPASSLVDDAEQAIDAANAIAPEHLELMCADADAARAARAQRGRGLRRARTRRR